MFVSTIHQKTLIYFSFQPLILRYRYLPHFIKLNTHIIGLNNGNFDQILKLTKKVNVVTERSRYKSNFTWIFKNSLSFGRCPFVSVAPSRNGHDGTLAHHTFEWVFSSLKILVRSRLPCVKCILKETTDCVLITFIISEYFNFVVNLDVLICYWWLVRWKYLSSNVSYGSIHYEYYFFCSCDSWPQFN